MKQYVILFSLTILLVACSDKDGTSNTADASSIAVSIDTSVNTTASVDDHDSGDPYTNSAIINKSGSTTIVTQKTIVYSDSLLQTTTAFVLNPEEHIRIENYCGITTKNNWAEPVYKITCDNGTDIIRGYVSQSAIACRVDTLKSNQLVTLTLDYDITKEKFIGKIALLNRGWDIIARTSVELNILKEDNTPHAYTYYFSFEEKETTGLAGITESFSIGTNYDACGYPAYDYTFLWNGKKLISCPETFSVSDSGLFYSHSYLIFPSDSLGKSGYIMSILQSKEYEEEQAEDGLMEKVNHDSTVIQYKWNAGNFTFLEGDTVLNTSRTYYSNP